METPEELKERLFTLVAARVDDFGLHLATFHVQLEQAYQLARIAESLDKIEKEGIFNYPMSAKEDEPETYSTSADNPDAEGG